MEKQNYKKYIITNRSDFIIYLRFLIVQSYKLIKKYDEYVKELESKINELNLINRPKAVIDSELYEEFNDKIQRISTKLLNLFGDLQADSLSYLKFRRQLVKRNIDVKKDLGELSEEILILLNQMNESRNWGLHEPESLLNAHFENIKTLWTKEDVEKYKTNFNPINVPFFKKYEGKWLISLFNECTNNKEAHSKIFESMLEDYQKLIGDYPEIKENYAPIREFESEIMIPKTSLLMQRKKYIGDPNK